MAFCVNCGFSLPDGSEFCPNCGMKLSDPAYGQQEGGAAPPPPQQGYYQQQTYYPPQPPSMEKIVLQNSFHFLLKKPIRLWGLSLLCSLLGILAVALSFLPILYLPIVFVLELGMTGVFLDGYQGKEINSDQLFRGFKNFFRSAGGMGWRELWIFIWALIPVVGFVFAVIKAYSYRFVPYILLQEPETSATDALRKSMAQTQGYKGQMFLADFLLIIVIVAAALLLFLLSLIPYVGILFTVVFVLLILAVGAFGPLLFGTVQAAFYTEISQKK